MAAPSYSAVQPEFANLWRTMVISLDHVPAFQSTSKRIFKNMARYRAIEKATGVPASVIAVIHERESGSDFTRYLGNGEPLNRITRLVPQGRGPFASFEEGAVDALKIDGLSKITDWPIERACYELEAYNGFGYRNKGVASPYLWAGTNHYTSGKYVADGKFDPKAVDQQLGAVPLLYHLWMLDVSLALRLSGPPEAKQAPPPPIAVQAPIPAPVPPLAPPVPSPTPSAAGPATLGGTGGVIAIAAGAEAGWPWWAVVLAGLAVVALIIGGIYLTKRK